MVNKNIDGKVISTIFLVGILLLVLLMGLLLSVNGVDAADSVTISDTNISGIRGAINHEDAYETIFLNPGNYNGTNNNTNISISNSSRNIVISGNGAPDSVTIDGLGQDYFFYIRNGANLTLKNLTLTNGIPVITNAGPLYNSNGTLVLENCIFKYNKGDNGGVLNIQDSTTITNCSFINNTAIRGGAIYNTGGQLSIANSNFINNSANDMTNGFGGALWVSNGIINIRGSNFTNNSATMGGGAVYASTSSIVKIEESSFLANSANGLQYGGGVLYTSVNSEITIIKSNFTLNTVQTQGGVIYSTNCTYDISGSRFEDNTAINNGGVIFNSQSIMNITSSNFTKNTANNCGGVIYNSNSNLNIINSLFDTNLANGVDTVNCAGGVIYHFNGNIAISYSKFLNNSATKSGVKGGVIANIGGTININYSQFNENKDSTGAVVFNRDILNIRNSNFTKNGFSLATSSNKTNAFMVENCIFTDNIVAIIYSTNNLKIDWTIGSNSFKNNDFVLAIDGVANTITIKGSLANNKNGILFTSNAGNNILRDSTINGITGYAILFNKTRAYDVIERCTLTNNFVAIYVNESIVIVNNSNINNNGNIGGKIASIGAGIYNNLGDLRVSSCNFYNNIASSTGSAIANIGGKTSVSYSTIIGNSPNCAVYSNGGSTIANFNWWGTNNPSGKTNFALEYYFTMIQKISTKSNSKSTGETVAVQYLFVLNGTTNNFNANSRFLYFSTNIMNNGKAVKTIDGRLSASYNIYISTINSKIQVQSGSHVSPITSFKAKKGITKLAIKSSSIFYKKVSPVKIFLSGKNKKGVAGKTLLAYVNGKYVGKAKTNSQGIATLKYKSSNFSKKSLKVVFKEDTHFKTSSNSANLGVVKSKTSIAIVNFSGAYNKKGKFSVVLKDQLKNVLSKKTVNFYINGKLVGKAKTNKKGMATVNPVIKSKGKVTISAKFLTESMHIGTTVTKTQQVR